MLATFRGVDTVDLPLVGSTSLWHAAFIAVGGITLLLALLTTTIREPPRIDSLRKAAGAAGEVGFWAHIREHWAAFWLVIGGYTCLGILAIGWFATKPLATGSLIIPTMGTVRVAFCAAWAAGVLSVTMASTRN